MALPAARTPASPAWPTRARCRVLPRRQVLLHACGVGALPSLDVRTSRPGPVTAASAPDPDLELPIVDVTYHPAEDEKFAPTVLPRSRAAFLLPDLNVNEVRSGRT